MTISLGPLIKDFEEQKRRAFWIGGTINQNNRRLKELIGKLDLFEEHYTGIHRGD